MTTQDLGGVMFGIFVALAVLFAAPLPALEMSPEIQGGRGRRRLPNRVASIVGEVRAARPQTELKRT